MRKSEEITKMVIAEYIPIILERKGRQNGENLKLWGIRMKIHIIGGSGSGKTYLANKLSKEYNVEHYDLDDLQWDNKAEFYGVKRSSDERRKMLQDILANDNWIIEGVYYKWCKQCFDEADKIYLLEVPEYIYKYRIIKRFVKRKLGIEKGKKETLKTLKDLLKWTKSYQENDMVEIKKILEPYSHKVVGM